MRKEWTEEIPAITIKHKSILCDNPACGVVIKDVHEPDTCPVCSKNFDVELTGHCQTGNKEGGGFLDFCSEKCLGKIVKG